MLGERPIDIVLLVKDLDRAREFDGGALQLEIVEETDDAISFRSGQTRVKASKSTTGTKDEQTRASWRVDDARAEMQWLRTRGVEPEEYDNDEVKTDHGVADQGDALVAWIVDPDGNVLGIEQSTR